VRMARPCSIEALTCLCLCVIMRATLDEWIPARFRELLQVWQGAIGSRWARSDATGDDARGLEGKD